MKLRDTKIGNQLILAFIAIFVFVSSIGILSAFQANQIQNNVETLYQHPLIVRRALSELKISIVNMQLHQQDLAHATDEKASQKLLDQIKLYEIDVTYNIDLLDEYYLGSLTDVLAVKQSYELWKSLFDNDTQLILDGDSETFIQHILADGKTETKLVAVHSAIQVVDDFALAKSESLYQLSIKTNNDLNTQLLITIIGIFILLALISVNLTRNIKRPIQTINDSVLKFHNGDLSSRIQYDKHNEFGLITESINKMADKVQMTRIVNDKINRISNVMLSEEDLNQFLKKTLDLLMRDTNAQIAAVYTYNSTTRIFDHLISIGGTQAIKQSFNADEFEGELGQAFLNREINIIKHISDETRFVYKTSEGNIVPHQIMTIPVIADQALIAVISLSTLNDFDALAITFVESIMLTMGMRIEGLLATQEIRRVKDNLEVANHELKENKKELSAQTIELIQQNTELEMQKNQLDEASKLKTSFLSNMSHELRTPLNSVIALSGILNRRLKDKVSPDEVEYLEIIERNGKNLLDLINDILDISRIEAGREEVTIDHFDMNIMVEELVDMIKPQADVKNIDLSFISDQIDLRIHSDIKKIQHILQNIIGNAVKFTEQGSVKVSCKARQNHIEVSVTDTGIGISEVSIPHIFDEFRQADGSTSRRYGGAGLGLAIAKKYTELLKGSISVKSELNVGSIFTVSLPIQFDDTAKTDPQEVMFFNHEPKKNLSIHGLTNKTILLVDDNETALIQIRDLLSDTGIHVLTANNAQEAFMIIDNGIPDAMVLDLMMPDIDGFKMLEILRNAEQTAHIPVLVLTAKHLTKADLSSLKRSNVHELILKGSIQKENLQNAIESMFKDTQTTKKPPLNHQDEIKPLILIVEDNPDSMTTTKALLGDHYKILEAVNGKEAILMAKASIPHLILMDIALPDINGIDAFKKIRTMRDLDNTPIIALTASAMEQERESILLHGFDAFIAKPINAQEFFKVIDEVLYGK